VKVKIIVDLIGKDMAGEPRHPAEILRGLGIEFESFEQQLAADQMAFFGCINVPANLPAYVRIAK
jgi:hypothetical protein